jgi:hypothetical protein
MRHLPCRALARGAWDLDAAGDTSSTSTISYSLTNLCFSSVGNVAYRYISCGPHARGAWDLDAVGMSRSTKISCSTIAIASFVR